MALTTRRRALTTLGAALAGAVVLPGQAWAGGGHRGPRPLWRAHAHNDYEHTHPLFDAHRPPLRSVEADKILVGV
ncbi:twin-arginine translocation signal domain-containing protein, partial [Streptomyces sp. NPDC005827]|uniref:twin-arginine translocation signal domain-containing protein n=1 Tax=Streptomyces sp. NPDC005827 TaxID=3157070 RepID=UPI0033FEB494